MSENLKQTGEQKRDTRSDTKKQWDFSVRLASIWCMRALISSDRITPEHVVSEGFDRLQTLVDKGAGNQKLMKLTSSDDGESMLSRMKQSNDWMKRSQNSPKKKLTRQRTTDFSGDGQQAMTASASDDKKDDGPKSRFGRKKTKETSVVLKLNPLLDADSDEQINRDGGTKVSNPLLASIDSDEEEEMAKQHDTKQDTTTKPAKVVDKRLAYSAKGKHAHWLAETYEQSSEEEQEQQEEVIKESSKARKARQKLERLKAQQKDIEDRRNGVYVAPAKKERKTFKMSTFLKANSSDGDDDSDSEDQTAQKSNLPHWLQEPEPAPQGETAKRAKRRNQTIKVGNPLFQGDSPKKTVVDNPLNTVSNPLLATMNLDSEDCSSDSDDSDVIPSGLADGAQHLSAFGGQGPAATGASAADVQATLDFKKTKAFMSRKTTIT